MNKYKKLAFNTGIFAIGNFGSKILVLLLTNLYTKYMSPADINDKDLLESSALFLIPIFSFGLQEYLIRFGLDKHYDKKQVFSTSACMTFTGFLGVALIVPLLKMIPLLNFINDYTILLITYTCMSTLRMLISQFVRARDMVKLFSLDGILATLTLLIFNLVFIGALGWGVKGFMLSVILSDFCSSVFLFKTAGLRRFLDIRAFSVPLAKSMMRFAMPLVPTIVMWTITSLSDRLFIRDMHSSRVVLGAGSAGLYGVANRIPNLISMVSTIFFQAWNMSAITENESRDRSTFYEKVYSTYEAILFMASAGLILLIKPVIASHLNGKPKSLGGIYNATKHTKNSFYTAFVTCVVNLVLNWILIPEWGIQGASIATVLSYYVCFWLRIIDARYYVPFKFNAVKSVTNTAGLFVMCALTIFQPPLYMLWLVLLTLIICAGNYQAIIDTVVKLRRR